MKSQELKKLNLPDAPGVYFFMQNTPENKDKNHILYIGKATSLRDRVRSYFRDDIIHTRGKRILDMVTLSASVRWQTTDSVLEALILEAALIKKHAPKYNSDEKDDKSWNYVVVTNEEFPRVLFLRERLVPTDVGGKESTYKYAFGPFPSGGALREALAIIRRIFPFRDGKCKPGQGRPCFNRQIGLCPGVCTGEISKTDYGLVINHIRLFFEGKKGELLRTLEREMKKAAKELKYERAGELKREIFAVTHIKDSSLVGKDLRDAASKVARERRAPYRIEAYDIAHISGTHTVGVMIVIEDGTAKKSDYRKFRIRSLEKSNDTLHLEEVLRRRFGHPEWRRPDLIAIDGGIAQKRRTEAVLRGLSLEIPVVSIVKDERHKPKGIMGSSLLAAQHKAAIILANAESHRFAVSYHRHLRGKLPK